MTEYISVTDELTERLSLFPRLRAAAREISLPLFANPQNIQNKSSSDNLSHDYDPVTSADIQAELALRQIIHNQFPHDHITGEEHEDIIGSNDFTWTLDPIDGTYD